MRKPSIRRDRKGVASTVGTIMALLVFLTFLSLIVNQYVPVWMKDSESSHMNTALGQFSTFKSSIDLQTLSVKAAQQARRHFVPVTAYSPITLGIDGVPIFSAPTTGELTSNTTASPWTVEFRKLLAGTNYTVQERASGIAELSVANRYFVAQDVRYENGAVIRSQNDGQFIVVEPSFQVIRNNQSVVIGAVVVSLFGSGAISGSQTEGIHHKVVGTDVFGHENATSDLYINGTTDLGVAWYHFYNKTLSEAYGISANLYGDCTDPDYKFCISVVGRQVNFIWVDNPYYYARVSWNPALLRYNVFIQIKNDYLGTDPLRPALTLISLEHAFANIAVGSINGASI